MDEHRAYTEATDSLWAAAYSPDGKRLASAGNDRTIRVYNTQTSKLETTLTGAKAPITSLAFFPDSNRLASAGGDQTVVVWDVESSTIVKTYTGHESAILSLAVSDDGKRIVSGSADWTVRAFSPESDKALWNWPARSAVCAVAIQKGNRFVAAGLADGTLVMLDISGSVPKEVFGQPAHVSGIACLAFTSNGQRLASVGGDGVLRVWTVGDDGALTQMNRFDGPSKAGNTGAAYALTGVAFTPDGRFVATVGADSTVRIWDVEGKTESRSLLGHTDWVTCVCFSPDGRSVASVGVEKDRALRVFELPPLDLSAVGGHHSEVNAAAISPSGKVVGTAGDDKTIRLWDIGSGKEFATLVGNADTPFALAFLGDDNLVMGGSLPTRDAGRLHFWGTKPERLLKSVPTGEVFTIVTNRDGKRLAAWVSTKVSGEKDTHHSYEIYDAAGNRQSVVLDQAHPERDDLVSERESGGIHSQPRLGRGRRRPGERRHLGPDGEEATRQRLAAVHQLVPGHRHHARQAVHCGRGQQGGGQHCRSRQAECCGFHDAAHGGRADAAGRANGREFRHGQQRS